MTTTGECGRPRRRRRLLRRVGPTAPVRPPAHRPCRRPRPPGAPGPPRARRRPRHGDADLAACAVTGPGRSPVDTAGARIRPGYRAPPVPTGRTLFREALRTAQLEPRPRRPARSPRVPLAG